MERITTVILTHYRSAKTMVITLDSGDFYDQITWTENDSEKDSKYLIVHPENSGIVFNEFIQLARANGWEQQS